MKIYCNGSLTDSSQMPEVFEPGFLFGWGVFEALRVYKKSIPFLKSHIQRLNQSLEYIGIEKVDMDWQKIILSLLNENKLDDAYIRITAYKKRKGTGVMIYAANFGYYPKEIYDKGFSAILFPWAIDTQGFSWSVKSLSYLDKRRAWFFAQEKKKDESLLIDRKGCIVGGSRSNLFLVKDSEIIVPSSSHSPFNGITKRVVIDIIRELNIKVKEKVISAIDVFSSDEAFLTSSLLEVMPLVKFDSEALGNGDPGEITLRVLSEYRKKI